MGQTLSHGVYLPNEGERNCYAGLASNWQILNTAVGAIAEKAPLVHTHTKSDITDFPAYGNTAGTICEGNDSRLSDARTPVAHTHTKADVTDLLNSNFIPSANNAYDLGSSSYQWNNLYAKKVNTQSVNGINPGALSLPGAYSSSVTEYITDKTGGNNAYTAPADGWVGIQANSATLDSTNFIFMGRISDGSTYFAQNTSSSITAYWSNQYHGCILLPVIGGKTYGIRCKCDTVDARFYKANGNVS